MVSIHRADLNTAEDADAVYRLLREYAANLRCPPDAGPFPDRQVFITGLRAQPCATVWLASIDGEACGVAVLFETWSTFAARPVINVHDLAVAPAMQGQGIGGRLLDCVVEHATSRDAIKVTLEIAASNEAAERLYRRFGFNDPGGEATRFLEHRLDD
ncbi:MAG: GNAT family N-acetyltransferase [Planctomycetaceae bacterium]